MSLTVRPIDYQTPAHRQGLVELLACYADTPQGSGAGMDSQAQASVAQMLEATPHAVVLLAEAEGSPVGVAVCCQGFSTFAARPLLNIHDLVVAPDYRGRGVGRRLMQEVEAAAIQRGCCSLTLEVVASNEPAKRLYRSCGFQGGDSATPADAMLFWKKPLS